MTRFIKRFASTIFDTWDHMNGIQLSNFKSLTVIRQIRHKK